MIGDKPTRASYWLSPRRLALLSVFLACGLFSLGYTLQGYWYISVIFISLAAVWIIAAARTWDWVPSGLFALFTISAGAGFYFSVEFHWLILGLLFALFAWDLQALSRRYDRAGLIIDESKSTFRHIRRLIIFEVLGLVLAIIAISSRIRMGFGWLVLLALIAVLGLSYGISYMMRKSH